MLTYALIYGLDGYFCEWHIEYKTISYDECDEDIWTMEYGRVREAGNTDVVFQFTEARN